MRAEIEYQVQDLCGLDLSSSSSPHPSPSPSTDSDCCLFVGSGDSYIAGLAAQYFSSSHAICCYPIDIIKNPSLVGRRNLFIVSISGNTQANILAAKKIGRASCRGKSVDLGGRRIIKKKNR